MPVMAIPLSERATVNAPIAVRLSGPATGNQVCDFSGDGRIVGAIVADRSAWRCPLFYLTVPVTALLFFTLAVIRFCRGTTGIAEDGSS
jgi:hypothetical protein